MTQFSSILPMEDYGFDQEEKNDEWRSSLDALSYGKISWEKFLQAIPIHRHPARLLTTTEGEESLLHLAIRDGRPDLVKAIHVSIPQLKWRRNSFNWTPLELARFLPRKEISEILSGLAPPFSKEPNVLVYDQERFEQLPVIEYIPQPVFESDAIFHEIVAKTKRAKEEDAILPEKIWMGIYFDKEIEKGDHPKVSIRYIDDKVGFGVFAEKRIPSCAFAGEYRGQIKERKKKELKDKVFCVRYTVWEMGRRKFILDAEKMGNFTRLINHSSKPNLSLQSVYWRGIPRMIFVAIKEIPEGTQLTFDYGMFFWKKNSQTPIDFE